MKSMTRVFAAVVFAWVAGAVLARAQTVPPPAEAFAHLPGFTDPHLSPDGKRFAVIQSTNGRSAVQVYPVNAPGAAPVICNSSDTLIEKVAWAGNDRLLIAVKMNVRINGRLYPFRRFLLTKSDCSNVHVLFSEEPDARRIVIPPHYIGMDPNDPNVMFMEMLGDGTTDHRPNGQFTWNLYRVSLTDGTYRLWQAGSAVTGKWNVDGDHVVARVDNYKDRSKHVLVPFNGDWKEIAAFAPNVEPDPIIAGVTEDGRSLAVTKRSPEGGLSLYPLNLETGVLGAALFTDPGHDVFQGEADEVSRRVVGVMFPDDGAKFVYFNAALAKLQRVLEKTFPGKIVELLSSDAESHAFIVSVEGADTPPGYYYFEPATMHASAIGSSYPDLVDKPLGAMKPYVYSSRDGLLIHGYLTTPPGKDSKNLPVVVLPHGGPDGVSTLSFRWEVQFLASRGYAVFQPNYRGSAGYGRALTEAGLQQLGLKAQDDITDGVKKLIADGVADPKRICIAGMDFGGYAALAGAAFTPDLYACAIGVAPVTNLRTWLEEREKNRSPESQAVVYWNSRFGNPGTDRTKLEAVSPALHADAVKIPVLLIHGRDDTVVPLDQSLAMQNALQKAHKPVTFVQLDGDDHDLELASSRLKVLTEMEKFLKANIGQ